MANRKIIAHKYYIKNKIEILKKKKLYNKSHAKEISIQRREYYLKNIKLFRKLHQTYVKTHQQEIKEYRRKYELAHQKEKKEYNSNYFKTYKNKLAEYVKNRLRTNINYRLASRLRTRIHEVLKGNSKSKTTMNLVGCSIQTLKQYLEKSFKSGMSWDNYGKWHIDHIRPCVSFDLSKEEEQRKCFNYINLQPLWAEDNLRKNKY